MRRALTAPAYLVLTAALAALCACDRGAPSGPESPAPARSTTGSSAGSSAGPAPTATTDVPPEEPGPADELVPAPPGPVEHPLFGVVDASAELEALAGTWSVAPHAGSSRRERWHIDGARVAVQGEGTGAPVEGRLEYTAPGQLTLVVTEGSGTLRTHYAYARARDGGPVFIGLGDAGTNTDGRFALRLGNAGYLLGDTSSCWFHPERRGFEVTWDGEGVEANCTFVEEGERTWLQYAVPDSRRGGTLREGRVTVLDGALVGSQLEAHEATREP
jgi:hypothetical protein